ncbi:MAG: 3-methyl-2-oxobutanoate hydroxymethyltransferase, partial [Candidatus Methylomirabilales bacterium]
MSHIGLTPQHIHRFGGFKVQGKTADQALALLDDAIALEEAGAFALVLEGIPSQVAKVITERLKIPTIGIGAGPFCDGQVLVTHDLLGFFNDFTPKFVKRYASLREVMTAAFQQYRDEVKEGKFPTTEHAYGLDPAEARALESLLEKRIR